MKKIAILLLFLFIIINLSGCWNIREVNDLGVCVAIGVDITKDDLLEITAQVIIPRRLAQEGYEGNAVVTYSTTGTTTFEVLRKLTTISSRKLYIGHIQLVVLGESLAERGLFESIDFFERDHEFRRQAHVLVSKGISARDILETGSVIELIPAVHLAKAIDNTDHSGSTRKVTLIELFKELNSMGNQIVLPTVVNRHDEKPKVAKNLSIIGTAVFKKDRLSGYLDEFETRGYLFTTGELKGGILTITSPTSEEDLVSLELLSVNGKMDVKIVDDEFILTVKVISDSNIGEQQRSEDLTTPEMMEYVKKESENSIKAEILKAFHKGQNEFKTDFFGFGEIVSKEYPQYWREIQEDWDTVFSNATVEIEVISNIRRSGQILQPSKPK